MILKWTFYGAVFGTLVGYECWFWAMLSGLFMLGDAFITKFHRESLSDEELARRKR